MFSTQLLFPVSIIFHRYVYVQHSAFIYSKYYIPEKCLCSALSSKYKGQSKKKNWALTYLITFELSNMDIYLDDISLKSYVIYLIT